MPNDIKNFRDLRIWQAAMDNGMEVFALSKKFPADERFSMIDQVRRSSRSVAANIAEAWRKRRYEKAFISKLNDAESEVAETQTWLEFAIRHKYLRREEVTALDQQYERLLAQLVVMINHPEKWTLPGTGSVSNSPRLPVSPSPVQKPSRRRS
jgi:four helix bundle protein